MHFALPLIFETKAVEHFCQNWIVPGILLTHNEMFN